VTAKAGSDRTTLADVAKTAEISTGTIRHYYSNKAALLVDVLVTARVWFQCRIRSQLDEIDPGWPRF
jgi:AcrR family transcriptional regulator